MFEPLKFKCPSCGGKFAPVPAMDVATQVVKRTCPACGERWQLTVRAIQVKDSQRMDAATLTFLGRKFVARPRDRRPA